MTLTELANKYGTDKGTTTEPRHGYTEIYEQYLAPMRESARHVLEIGIQYGASLRMWRDYFPSAEVVGIDNDSTLRPTWTNNERLNPVLGDVRDPNVWEWIRGIWRQFDLIVDDGSHLTADMDRALRSGWPLLRKGGFYIIEDLHQSYAMELDQPIFRTLYAMWHEQINERGELQTGRRVLDGADVEYLHLYKSLAILKKR